MGVLPHPRIISSNGTWEIYYEPTVCSIPNSTSSAFCHNSCTKTTKPATGSLCQYVCTSTKLPLGKWNLAICLPL